MYVFEKVAVLAIFYFLYLVFFSLAVTCSHKVQCFDLFPGPPLLQSPRVLCTAPSSNPTIHAGATLTSPSRASRPTSRATEAPRPSSPARTATALSPSTRRRRRSASPQPSPRATPHRTPRWTPLPPPPAGAIKETRRRPIATLAIRATR